LAILARADSEPPNFFFGISKFSANFCVSLSSFSKLLFGGFGEFQRLRGEKFGDRAFWLCSKFLRPPRIEFGASKALATPRRRTEPDALTLIDVKQPNCSIA
jgi:hypothetical protein